MTGAATVDTVVNALVKNLIDATCEWHRIFTKDRIRQLANAEVMQDLETFISEMRMIRWSIVSTEDRVIELWNKVMPGVALSDGEVVESEDTTNQDIVDYVLNGVTFIMLKVPMSDEIKEKVIGDIAKSIAWTSTSNAIDSALKDRAADLDFVFKVFSTTPWLLFMFLLSMSPISFDDAFSSQAGNSNT